MSVSTHTLRRTATRFRLGGSLLAAAACVWAAAAMAAVPKSTILVPDAHIGLYQAGAPQSPDSLSVDTHLVPNSSAGWMNRGFSSNSATVDIDAWVRWTESMNMEPIITLQSLAPGDSISSFPADTLAWKLWVTSIVERYDDDGFADMPGLAAPIHRYHVEQEWHIWWNGTLDDYLTYLSMTYRVIHAVDPKAQVILVGLATQTVTAGAVCLQNGVSSDSCNIANESVDEATQLLQRGLYDIVDMHSYESWPIIAAKVAWIRSVARDPAVPIWSLEAGGPSGYDGTNYNDALNAAALVQQFAQALGNGVERYTWALFPPGPGTTFDFAPWTNMPLTAWEQYPDSLAVKPAYYSYRLLVRMLSGFTSAANMSTGSVTDTLGAFMYRFQIGDSTVYIVWNSDSTERDVTFHIAGGAALVTHIVSEPGQTDDEAQVDMVWPVHGNITYAVTPTPVFFKFIEAATDAPPLVTPPDTHLGALAVEVRGSVARGGVRFRVHGTTRAAEVGAVVYDARGRAVREVGGSLHAAAEWLDGRWDGADASGTPAAAGVYYLAVRPRPRTGAPPVVARFVRLAH